MAVVVTKPQKGIKTRFTLCSPTFAMGKKIPILYTHWGADVSPPLQWENPPEGTRSFALIMEDPDAPGGTWVHWIIYNIFHDHKELEANLTHKAIMEYGIKQGYNSWNTLGYRGPAPPSGTHHYYFRLYALDILLNLDTPRRSRLLSSMRGHVLGQTEFMGIYKR